MRTSANAPAVGNDKSKSPYIVIIEDYEPLSRALCEMFRQRGNRCFAIRSKTSAEQFLRQVRPDLVVLDYQLIGGVGLEAAQIASEKNVPVISIGYVWPAKKATARRRTAIGAGTEDNDDPDGAVDVPIHCR